MAHFHVLSGADTVPAHPEIHTINLDDIKLALARGVDDFSAQPSHLVFLALIYPVIGAALAFWASGANLLPLLFPLMSGFALLGPLAAIGLYEISRRRELGLDSSWRRVLEIRHSPSIPAILAVGLGLAVLFVAWLATAQGLFHATIGDLPPTSYLRMLRTILTSAAGWQLIVLGNLAGLAFAVVALCSTVVAFPLLLDRDVGAAVAVTTSFRAVRENPVMLALWGLIVALGLAAGFLLFFAGLAVVLPMLGHATWHLYRRVVVPVGRGERNLAG